MNKQTNKQTKNTDKRRQTDWVEMTGLGHKFEQLKFVQRKDNESYIS